MQKDLYVCKINYYDDFHCLMDCCPDNCCRGWQIPLDAEAYRRFRKEKGLFGWWLRRTICGKEDKRFSALSIRCPHLRADGLCALQRKKGEAYLPDVCRDFPRSCYYYGPRAEYHLDLSCIHAASLFLHHYKEQALVESDFSVDWECFGNNDDTSYFEKLLDLRTSYLDALSTSVESAEALDMALRRIVFHSRRLQDALLRCGGGDWAIDGQMGEERIFPLPIHQMNEMMSTCFYEAWLKYSSPFLYRLCRMYYRHFDRLSHLKGEEELERLFQKHVGKDGKKTELFAAYFASLLYRKFLPAYEDYSPYRHVMDAVIGLNLLLLFYLLWTEKYGKPNELVMAHLIAVCEKRIYHNDMALKDLHAALAGKGKMQVDV